MILICLDIFTFGLIEVDTCVRTERRKRYTCCVDTCTKSAGIFCGESDAACCCSDAGSGDKIVAHLPGTIAYGVAQPAESSCGIPDQPADLPGITSAKFWHEDRCGLSGKADDNLSVRSGGGLEEVSVHCAESGLFRRRDFTGRSTVLLSAVPEV